MKIAIFGDVHGNLQGLQAILEDIEKEVPDSVVCTGDLVCPWPDSLKCWEIVLSRNIPIVRGNQEEYILAFHDPDPNPLVQTSVQFMPVQYAAKQFGPEHLCQMENLPLTHIIPGPDLQDVLVCHGIPSDPFKTFALGIDSSIAGELNAVKENVVVAGHIHQKWHKKWNGKLLILAGSGGFPLDGQIETVDYLVLTYQNNSWDFTHKSIPYDHQDFIDGIVKRGALVEGGPISWIMLYQLLTQQGSVIPFFSEYLPSIGKEDMEMNDLREWEDAAAGYIKSLGYWEEIKKYLP